MKKHSKSLVALILSLAFMLSVFTGCTQAADYSETVVVHTENGQSENISESETEQSSDDEGEVIYYGEPYTDTLSVSAYIYEWQELPPNYITKNEAESLGWQSNKGNLWEVADGRSIGGDKFGNREGLLPGGENYRECDVNYAGGYRDAERLVYSTDDYDIYYTSDHYESFEQVYDAELGYVWDENIVFE
ncbi:MAG: ribonuclease [Oscillospiraceae bacterium]|nr:ribonuclease [Oscillospiraceae bacterium]MBQ7816934.1 ribonuclease [Oscillospiraceae bacterium]